MAREDDPSGGNAHIDTNNNRGTVDLKFEFYVCIMECSHEQGNEVVDA